LIFRGVVFFASGKESSSLFHVHEIVRVGDVHLSRERLEFGFQIFVVVFLAVVFVVVVVVGGGGVRSMKRRRPR
jgi:hypothetical protein